MVNRTIERNVGKVGVVPDGNGDFVNVEIEIIDRVNENKSESRKGLRKSTNKL